MTQCRPYLTLAHSGRSKVPGFAGLRCNPDQPFVRGLQQCGPSGHPNYRNAGCSSDRAFARTTTPQRSAPALRRCRAMQARSHAPSSRSHDCSCYRPPRLSSGWERRVNYDGKRSGLLGAEITASGASRSLWLGVAAGGSRRSRRHSTGLWAQCANMPRSVIERPLRHENAADDRSFVYAFKPLRPNLIFRTHATDVFVNP